MKVLYVVSGIGFGDATREHSNMIALKKKFPGMKIMVAGYDNSLAYFQDKFNTIKIRGYKLPGKAMKIDIFKFGLRNFFLPAFWLIGTLKIRLESFNFIPDLIISDFEPVGISLAKVLNKKCIVVFGFDPELYREYAQKNRVNYKMQVEAKYFEKLYDQADLVIIPTFRRRRRQHLLYSYVNPIVRIKPEELHSEEMLMKELQLKRKPVLVMLGGSEFGAKLAKNINRIADMTKEDFIIFGGNLNTKFSKNVRYIKFTPNFLKYLKVCKGVITLGGHKTLSEALVYKKPILCFPIQDHVEQVLNAESLRDTIMISHSSSYNAVKDLVPAFIKDLPNLQKRADAINLKGNGAEQVADIISSVLTKNLKKKGLKSSD